MASEEKVEAPSLTDEADPGQEFSPTSHPREVTPAITVRLVRSRPASARDVTPLVVRPALSRQPSLGPTLLDAPPATGDLTPYLPSGPPLSADGRPDLDLRVPRVARFAPSFVSRIWRARGFWLGLIAFAIGAGGEWLLFQPSGTAGGMGIMAVAMVVGIVAWTRLPERYSLAPRLATWREWRSLISLRRQSVLRLLGIAGALGLLGASLAFYLSSPDEIFGWQGVLWLLSIALLLVSCAHWYPRESNSALLPPWTRSELLLFGGILAFALLTHLLWLDQYPWRVDPNEFLAFTDSMRMYADPPRISMFTTTWLGTSMPSLWFVPEAAFMHLLGTTGLAGVRFWPALVGALQVVPVYLLARLAWGRTEAVVSAFAVGFMAVSIHYSRISFPNPGVPLGWAFCFYFILRGLRTRRPNDFVWAGLAAGFSMYSHYSTRLLPYVVLAFFGYMLLFHFKVFREHIGHFLLVPVGYVVGFGPLLAYFYSNPQMWAGRGLDNLLVPASIPTTWAALVADWNIVSHQLVQNFLSLSVISAQDSFYWAPFMFPVEAIILMLGVGVLLWRWRQPASFLVLLWGVSVMFVISLVEVPGNGNPNFAHWSAAHPAFFLAFGLPVALCLRSLRLSTAPRWWRAGYAWATVGLVILALANINFYVNIYPARVPADAYLYSTQGRYLQSLSPDTLAYYVARSSNTLNVEIGAMMGPKAAASQLFNPSRQLPLPGTPDKNLDFVFFGDTLEYLPVIQEYYPQGSLQRLTAPQEDVALQTVYHVTAKQAISRFGVIATITQDNAGGAVSWRGIVPAVGALPDDAPLVYPLTTMWSGALYLPAPEQVVLTLPGLDNARLWVMGEPQALGSRLDLDAGWVPFSVEAHIPSGGNSSLLYLQEGEPGSALPIARTVGVGRLWPEAPNTGLALTLSDGSKTVHRIDPFIGSALSGAYPFFQSGTLTDADVARYFASLNLALPGKNPAVGAGRLRWEGSLLADNDRYTMDLHTNAHAQLSIDGAVVLTKCDKKGNGPSSPILSLSPGWHSVRIDFEPSTGDKGLEWLWTALNGTPQLVLPSRLRYADSVPPNGVVNWPSPPPPIACGP